jgi:hypothetical protein
MTEYEKTFINDIMYKMDMGMKVIKSAADEMESYIDIKSDDIKNNLSIIANAMEGIRQELLWKENELNG